MGHRSDSRGLRSNDPSRKTRRSSLDGAVGFVAGGIIVMGFEGFEGVKVD